MGLLCSSEYSGLCSIGKVNTIGNLDEAAICAVIVIFQLIYGVAEGVEIWSGWLKEWHPLVGTLVALAIAAKLYFKRLVVWWEANGVKSGE